MANVFRKIDVLKMYSLFTDEEKSTFSTYKTFGIGTLMGGMEMHFDEYISQKYSIVHIQV